MIIWSVIPPDIMFNTTENLPIYEEIEWTGMKCLVEKTSPTQCKVVRLLTTDPKDYLRIELQPGSILTYGPIVKALS